MVFHRLVLNLNPKRERNFMSYRHYKYNPKSSCKKPAPQGTDAMQTSKISLFPFKQFGYQISK